MTNTRDYLPQTDSGLRDWAANFNARIVAEGGGAGSAWGISQIQIVNYTNAFNTYDAAYVAANENSTRTPPAIQAKNNAREALEALSRELVAIVQINPAMTDQIRSELQITIRDTEPSPAPIPANGPQISILSTVGSLVKIRLRDVDNPDSRAKPEGVYGATVMTAFGAAPPLLSDSSAWTLRGTTTRTLTTLEFPDAPSGTTAWITAFWLNTRGEASPPTLPVSVQVPGQLQAESESLQFPEDEGLSEAA